MTTQTSDKEFLFIVLTSNNVVDAIEQNLDKLIQIIPELQPTIGFDHKHPHHHLDVWGHTLLAISLSPNNFETRLALLLHDIGKPHSFQDEGTFRHFWGHADVSAQMSKQILTRLNFAPNFVEDICHVIENHDTPLTPDDIKLNKLSHKIFEVQCSDALAHNPQKNARRIQYIENTKKEFLRHKITTEQKNTSAHF